MAITQPYIPENITVHLGAPGSDAPNVTVNYVDYLKNVVAGEIYPTWEPSAIRANVLAINSYALNRIYTEYYRSRGYDFDITATTAYDQSYSYGRSTFENTDAVVEELFDTYIRRQGFTEPLAAKFCNGTTVTCEGLSQWGSQALAQQGLDSVQILRTYYGEDIELVTDAPIRGIEPSYPGTPLQRGSSGTEVLVMQLVLNRISQDYPSIPKVDPDGVFGPQTESAVRTFQRVFGLTDDGVVGRATWYQIVRIYVAVKRLAELQSEGLQYYLISWAPQPLREGDESVQVAHLQYMLDVVSRFTPEVPHVDARGRFDASTAKAVSAFQHFAGLPESGEVDGKTWECLCDCFTGIENTVLRDPALFPAPPQQSAQTITQLQKQLRTLAGVFPAVRAPALTGRLDRATRTALATWQTTAHLPRTGSPDERTLRSVAAAASLPPYRDTTREYQTPAGPLAPGQRDPAMTEQARMDARRYLLGRPIRMLQMMLRCAGQTHVIPDGYYGGETAEAVRRFRTQQGLPPADTCDADVWAALVRACNSDAERL